MGKLCSSRGWLLHGGARWFSSRKISGDGNIAEDQVSWEDHIIEDNKVTGRSGTFVGVRCVYPCLNEHKIGELNSQSLARIYHPPSIPRGQRLTKDPLRSPKLPLMIFFPSGLPVYVPPSTPETTTEDGPGLLLITDNDHNVASLLAVSSNYIVIVPGYFKQSEHIMKQLSHLEHMALLKTKEPMPLDNGVSFGPEESDKGKNSTSGPDNKTGAAMVLRSGGWVYPYMRHPKATHHAFRIYDCILQNFPSLLGFKNEQDLPQEISLCMSGSLIGASLAAAIALTEFKHPPFDTWEVVTTNIHTFGGTPTPVSLRVELRSLALVTPIVNWCFDPLGGYDFSAEKTGMGSGWLLPPTPPLSQEAAHAKLEGGPFLIPAPTLPALLRLRNAYFLTPEDYIDQFASPLFFMQTPGLDVGKDSLGRLWVSLKRKAHDLQSQYAAFPESMGSMNFRLEPIEIITMEGTKRKKVGRRWPPSWGNVHLQGKADVRRGGLPKKGRVRVVVPGEGEDLEIEEAVWGERYVTRGTRSQVTDSSTLPTESAVDIVDEYEEYVQDHGSVDHYQHSRQRVHLLRNSHILHSRLTSPPLSTTPAGSWLVYTAGEFVNAIARSWRSVVSADRNLRRDLERAKEEKEEERRKRQEKLHGPRGFLKVDREETVPEVSEKEVVEEEEEVEVDSVLDVIRLGEGMSVTSEERMRMDLRAVVRMGQWVADMHKLS